jgi:outer membrane lipoprotein-sorting protein
LRNRFTFGKIPVIGVLLGVGAVFAGCAVRSKTRVPASLIPPTPLIASAGDLIARVNAQSERIQTLTAKVGFAPTTGSVYSGVIQEYHDVRGFILFKKPAMIRIIGQAPVVRTNIFDMVSDGEEFRLSIPPKNKFIVGKTSAERPVKSPLENMRPRHILDALFIPSIDTAEGRHSFESAENTGRRFYILTIFQPGNGKELFPERKVWFDRSNLEVARLDLYGPGGALIETADYSGYQDYAGVTYPSEINIVRPVEDYSLSISIEKATFNQDIAPDKFELKKPADADLVELGALSGAEAGHGH